MKITFFPPKESIIILPEAQPKRTEGGILLPDGVNLHSTVKAEVVAKHPDSVYEVGDTVLVRKSLLATWEYEGVHYMTLEDCEVLAGIRIKED